MLVYQRVVHFGIKPHRTIHFGSLVDEFLTHTCHSHILKRRSVHPLRRNSRQQWLTTHGASLDAGPLMLPCGQLAVKYGQLGRLKIVTNGEHR